MISLQHKLRQMGVTFATLTDHAYHYWRPVKNLPCLIWFEVGEENSFHADDHKACQNIQGEVHVYTKTEFDPLMDAVQDALNDLGVAWTWRDANYEDETNLIHYSWVWNVATDGTR